MIWSPLRNKKMSDFLLFHSIIQAMQTRKKKLEKQFETCSVILCLLKQQEPHCLSSTEECFESPRWTPKSFKGTFVPRTGWRHFTQQMRDTLGVLNSVLGFFPQLPFFTVKWQCKHISLHHMNLELKRAAKSFCDNCQATSESQLCIFSSPAGTTFLHNRELIFCRTFPPCTLSQAKEEGDKNLPQLYLFNISNLTQNFSFWATLNLLKMQLRLLWAGGWMKWSVLTWIIPQPSNTGNF